MRFSYLLALSLVLALAGAQWYQSTKYICPVPITYRLGMIDESFAIDEEGALAAIASAAEVWESVSERDLFRYDESADFAINFVFDDRQATADARSTELARLDALNEQNEELRDQISDLETKFTNRQSTYEQQVAAYEARLAAYDERVKQANDRGGANPTLFAELAAERSELQEERQRLNTENTGLVTLAQQFNDLTERGNQIFTSYNQEVATFNQQYGQQHEFTQGDYQGGEINVYKFTEESELVAVLAHEFGHALGIDHIEQDGSLMYYLLNDELDRAPQLSSADIEAFHAVCSNEGWESAVRGHIRTLLAAF